jgi:glutathione S-transferase
MKLYDMRSGLNPRRVRIFLAEKGLELPKVEVDMVKGDNRTAEFLALNPLGTLPVLELDDGTVLTESIAICRYLEELHPDPPLFGVDPLDRAKVEMWNRRAELEILVPATGAFIHGHKFWEGRRRQVPDYAVLARETALERFAWLDGELATREYLAGPRYTVADITLQCSLVLAKNTGLPVPEGCINLQRWFAAVSARPTARA